MVDKGTEILSRGNDRRKPQREFKSKLVLLPLEALIGPISTKTGSRTTREVDLIFTVSLKLSVNSIENDKHVCGVNSLTDTII